MTIPMNEFIWPSDRARADNDELDRVCEYLEEVLDEIEGLDELPTQKDATLSERIRSVDKQREYERLQGSEQDLLSDLRLVEKERDAALEREQALAAYLDRLSRAIGQCMTNDERKFSFSPDDYSELEDALDATFSESLTKRDLIKQAEELEEIAAQIGILKPGQVSPVGFAVSLRMRAKDKRQQAEGDERCD